MSGLLGIKLVNKVAFLVNFDLSIVIVQSTVKFQESVDVASNSFIVNSSY